MISLLFPVRSRLSEFADTFCKYKDLQRSENVEYIVTIDDDDAVFNHPVVKRTIIDSGAKVNITKPKGKIAACNAGAFEISKQSKIIVLASDDMIPQVEGWDIIIQSDMDRWFPDGDGVLFYHDGFTPLNTMCILGVPYYNRFGYIYHPSYISLWCDNEFMEVADRLGKQVFIRRNLFRHDHWSNTGKSQDGLMRVNESYYQADKKNFEQRKAANFK